MPTIYINEDHLGPEYTREDVERVIALLGPNWNDGYNIQYGHGEPLHTVIGDDVMDELFYDIEEVLWLVKVGV